MPGLLQSEERVLSTLNADGTRRWLTPKISAGAFWKKRRIVAYFLVALFVVLPWLHADGRQLFFLDITHGEFTLFGKTFIRTDTLLLALLMITIFVMIFLLTALFGRVWCGWACPQTVYLEFVFRPIERLFDGKKNKPGPLKLLSLLPPGARKAGKWVTYALFSFLIANTFLAYFVGTDQLVEWITSSPARHPFGFGVVVFVTAAMLFDFGFFREQLCIVACPYGRFQSVMLDQHSLVVGYDYNRGEPRGHVKHKKKARTPEPPDASAVPLKVVNQPGGATATAEPVDISSESAPELGDCVDCYNCVKVCPTGIDIRDGLQMECIHCTQCIDACNDVMTKLGRPKGLIRYSTQAALETGKWKMLRPRVILYPLVLLAVLTALTFVLSTKSTFDVAFIRGQGMPFNTLPTGEISNQGRIRITNRTREPHTYTIHADGVEIRSESNPIEVEPGETFSERALVVMPRTFFAGTQGHRVISIEISDDQGERKTIKYKVVGPVHELDEQAPPDENADAE
ncbi:MAG TPA: 4Fe-4S binding protein, partial [Phycisphaerales bacterium]|nr:4Fe-4S binding protein [Phycisphaerales bacterium]